MGRKAHTHPPIATPKLGAGLSEKAKYKRYHPSLKSKRARLRETRCALLARARARVYYARCWARNVPPLQHGDCFVHWLRRNPPRDINRKTLRRFKQAAPYDKDAQKNLPRAVSFCIPKHFAMNRGEGEVGRDNRSLQKSFLSYDKNARNICIPKHFNYQIAST